ncbi:MAG: thiosulfate/3-mercaptopyruvate sulfurtransferase [Chloroflexota bacterium]|jgi:thiosulfate/3-mercaptopyruvate sulfurtransferase|nr:thiosulfate/3-mercaptopyruvate sulfurtransferase [Chloroflexota bacterium]
MGEARAGLVSAAGLVERLRQDPSGTRVIDLRPDPADGRPGIPGAAWADLHDGFAQRRPERNLAYDLPRPEEFAAALSKLGIVPDTDVVLADDMGNRWATRVYWLLRYFGHRGDVAVLDGGITAYLASGGPTDSFAFPSPRSYPVPTGTDETIRITADELLAAAGRGELVVCDVRDPREFTGEVAMSGRGGHIPGAVNVPWDRCLAADGTFLPDVDLRVVLAPYLDAAGTPVTYCQGGIRASLTWFSLDVVLGRPARLYAASWEEWAQRNDLPTEVENDEGVR